MRHIVIGVLAAASLWMPVVGLGSGYEVVMQSGAVHEGTIVQRGMAVIQLRTPDGRILELPRSQIQELRELPAWIDLYESAMAAIRGREFKQAGDLLGEIVSDHMHGNHADIDRFLPKMSLLLAAAQEHLDAEDAADVDFESLEVLAANMIVALSVLHEQRFHEDPYPDTLGIRETRKFMSFWVVTCFKAKTNPERVLHALLFLEESTPSDEFRFRGELAASLAASVDRRMREGAYDGMVEGKDVEILARAAMSGIPVCLTLLGQLVQHGQIQGIDPGEADDFYRLAVRLNEPNAMYILGMRAPDSEEFSLVFRAAREHHHVDSMYVMGMHYASRMDRNDMHRREAIRWLQRASQAGHAQARDFMQDHIAWYEEKLKDDRARHSEVIEEIDRRVEVAMAAERRRIERAEANREFWQNFATGMVIGGTGYVIGRAVMNDSSGIGSSLVEGLISDQISVGSGQGNNPYLNPDLTDPRTRRFLSDLPGTVAPSP